MILMFAKLLFYVSQLNAFPTATTTLSSSLVLFRALQKGNERERFNRNLNYAFEMSKATTQLPFSHLLTGEANIHEMTKIPVGKCHSDGFVRDHNTQSTHLGIDSN
jgi:hypothetical protein